MATIAGIDVGAFVLPERDRRKQNITVGKAADGTKKRFKYRSSDRLIVITINGKTRATMDALSAALEADADGIVSIDPDLGVNFGGGDGVAVNAMWLDEFFDAVKEKYEKWGATLTFERVV